ALLMQIAHPLVAAGVAAHSNFRDDPWRRLRATLRSYLTIIYGTTTAARAEIARLNRFHRSISGPGYEARDPELSLWVHATLIDATLVAYHQWIRPVGHAERAAFYLETMLIGRAFGVPASLLPADIEAFDAYLERMTAPDGPVRVGRMARELGESILRPKLGPLHPALAGIPASLYAWTLWPAIGILPESIRAGYELRWGVRERAVSAWLTAGFQAWRPLLPVGFRTMPWALRADARVAQDGRRPL
ncbi:MAG: oxygenase MpaB family protein, partial [Candidatus Limnocylindrales bacterium]